VVIVAHPPRMTQINWLRDAKSSGKQIHCHRAEAAAVRMDILLTLLDGARSRFGSMAGIFSTTIGMSFLAGGRGLGYNENEKLKGVNGRIAGGYKRSS
jgi:hypothetical protein